MNNGPRVVIVGAGISGLATAFWLHRAGVEVVVLESRVSVGGTMQTLRDGGWLIERGPNSALETTPLFGELFDALGIAAQRRYANPAGDKRYVLRSGTLHPIPMSPVAFLRTQLWSPAAKLRLLKEPFVGKADREESVAEFVVRRLGREFLDYAINPFVAGVFAGNPEELSVRIAFPKLFALEEKYGGLIRGMVLGARERKRRAEKAKDRAKMFSFIDGMETFPKAIAEALGSRVRTNTRVVGCLAADTPAGGRYRLDVSSGGHRSGLEADVVVLSVPAYVAAGIVAGLSPSLSAALNNVFYPPVAEVFLGFSADQIGRALDGFGYLIPAIERRNILGTIWSSVLFGDRAPVGHVALTSFVGGSRSPELLDCADEELLGRTGRDLSEIMGVRGQPVYARVERWERAIPQYTLGHAGVLEAIDRCEAEHPGLFFCSNYRGGIAVGDCIMSSRKIADRVTDHMRWQNPQHLSTHAGDP